MGSDPHLHPGLKDKAGTVAHVKKTNVTHSTALMKAERLGFRGIVGWQGEARTNVYS